MKKVEVKINDTIEWRSPRIRYEGNGRHTHIRNGVVKGVIPAGASAIALLEVVAGKQPTSRVKIGSDRSTQDRYLVEVCRSHATTGVPIASHWYAPRQSSVNGILETPHS